MWERSFCYSITNSSPNLTILIFIDSLHIKLEHMFRERLFTWIALRKVRNTRKLQSHFCNFVKCESYFRNFPDMTIPANHIMKQFGEQGRLLDVALLLGQLSNAVVADFKSKIQRIQDTNRVTLLPNLNSSRTFNSISG